MKEYDFANPKQRDSSEDEEVKGAITKKEQMKHKKATIRLHSKLGPQTAVYRVKKEFGAISTDGHNEKTKRDVIASGGDYDEETSFANDYDDSVVHQSASKFNSGF